MPYVAFGPPLIYGRTGNIIIRNVIFSAATTVENGCDWDVTVANIGRRAENDDANS